MNDEKIRLAICDKDEGVMGQIMDRYSRLLWSVASSVLVNSASEQDVEECVADVFIEFWLHPGKYDPEKGKLSSYLAMIARSRAIDRYRQITRGREVPIEEELAAGQSGLLVQLVAKEERDELAACVRALEKGDREIILRRYFYGQKPREIALALNLPKKQVENRLYLTKRKLKKMMEKCP